MPERPDKPEPTQRTSTGAEIPVPTRDAFLRDLRKVSEPDPRADERAEFNEEAARKAKLAQNAADDAMKRQQNRRP